MSANLNRRGFFLGCSAVAVAAAMPAAAVQSIPEIMPFHPPIFDGAIGEYCGIIIREMKEISGIPDVMLGARDYLPASHGGPYVAYFEPNKWAEIRKYPLPGVTEWSDDDERG